MQVPVQTGSAHLIAGSDLVIIDSGIAELGSGTFDALRSGTLRVYGVMIS